MSQNQSKAVAMVKLKFASKLFVSTNLRAMAWVGDAECVKNIVVAPSTNYMKVYSFGCKVYLLFSMGKSIGDETHAPSMTNDLFWLHWNATATQTFVIDMFNAQLSTTSMQEVVISSLEHATLKDYSLKMTTTDVDIGYGRMIQYSGNLTQLSNAIEGIRSTPANRVLWMMTQYCWVDFDFRWEIAHTAARQVRCQQKRYRSRYFEMLFTVKLWGYMVVLAMC
ncbi:hypothetical protein THRCLA_22592 [Thraustotheca clavata]|uniref:Uncharacterized protein n=1 Tax=Thraustotheca clavata TaxID=74557 RepID=A0A1V9YWF0_9STRA|nr:hypothetical protein THRCLA_22592 [Thraustotheca clavata]